MPEKSNQCDAATPSGVQVTPPTPEVEPGDIVMARLTTARGTAAGPGGVCPMLVKCVFFDQFETPQMVAVPLLPAAKPDRDSFPDGATPA